VWIWLFLEVEFLFVYGLKMSGEKQSSWPVMSCKMEREEKEKYGFVCGLKRLGVRWVVLSVRGCSKVD
jgi:hypothetical protein